MILKQGLLDVDNISTKHPVQGENSSHQIELANIDRLPALRLSQERNEDDA